MALAEISKAFGAIRGLWRRFARGLSRRLPKGLFGRALIIIVAPMFILQSVVAFVFMERHWQTVTRRLSAAVTQDIAAVIDVVEQYPQDEDYTTITRIARDRLGLTVSILPPDPLPPAGPKPFFSLLDRTLSEEITRQIGKPFWVDTVGRSNLVEIRIQLDGRVLRVFARRSQTYASNSHIFLVWMVGTSLVLIGVAMIFLRNQVRPIQRLAEAAEGFGKGRPIGDFRPSGAREVRRAAQAFIQMRARIERQRSERTTMLAGVSHDLRTILTRFRLELALLEGKADVSELARDVDEMTRMLEAYLAFSRGDGGEQPEELSLSALLDELKSDAERQGAETVTVAFEGPDAATLRPAAFKRCLANLVANAVRYGRNIEISARHASDWLTIVIDDDGPGIPADKRDLVFRPFLRLDEARNQDAGGTGLGLAIARDIARGHGGNIELSESPKGGLRATVRVPA